MTDSIKTRFVGLDVHKDSIVIAWRTRAGKLAGDRDNPHEWKALRKELDKLGQRSTVHCCYEAGPQDTARQILKAAGWSCDVIAPLGSQEERRADQDRSSRCSEAGSESSRGELVTVFILDEQTEAIRDWSGCVQATRRQRGWSGISSANSCSATANVTQVGPPGTERIRLGSLSKPSSNRHSSTSWLTVSQPSRLPRFECNS